jgi:hypothetical protein
MNYTISLSLSFSDPATAWSGEKFAQTAYSASLSGVSATPLVAFISNYPKTCPASEKTLASSKDGVIADCECLTPMELRRRYPGEASSHRNMLSRQRARGAIIHRAFREFASFLRHVGPKPTKHSTLDRIDNTDPEYAPGKVRWADKRTQNSNKGDSLTFHDRHSGEVFTTSRLARLQGVSQSTIRKRHERGWSDLEIIEGARLIKTRLGQQAQPRSMPVSRRHFDRSARETDSAWSPPPRIKTAAEIQLERTRESVEHDRRENGGRDLLPMIYDEFIEMLEEDAAKGDISAVVHLATRDEWRERAERRFREVNWPPLRPHFIWELMIPAHRAYIEKIDPEWAEQQKAMAASKTVMSDLL